MWLFFILFNEKCEKRENINEKKKLIDRNGYFNDISLAHFLLSNETQSS